MAIITNNNGFNISNLLDDINLYKFNPSNIQRSTLDHLRNITDGKIDIVDPTNPFVFLLESSAVNTAAFMIENEANTRKQYPAVAQTPEDVYLHMSDKDYIDRFATPAITKFSIMMQKDDLIGKMVNDPVTLGKKVTIARNTEFTVAETTFSLQYPIDIKQLSHGGIIISYDATITSPLQDLQSNNIDFDIRTDSTGIEWIYFEFEVYQIKVNSITAPVSPSISFNQEIELTDSFYFARVFCQGKTDPKSWVEIYTTHSDQVYNTSSPTAVLKVANKKLTVTIPQIYINSNLVTGTLRIDTYETKGNITMVLDNYPITAFSTKIKSIDTNRDTTVYTSAMVGVNYIAYSTKSISGGTQELDFESLKQKVIMNSVGPHNLPITNIQIESSLEKQGYQVVKNIDVITNRIFLATKPLPTPFDEKLITAGSASIETFIITMKDAITHPGVKNNDKRITFTPDIIYKNNSGIISIVPKAQIDSLLNLTTDIIAINVTNNNYLYSPFYYVMDTTKEEFELRPYYLDNPVIETIKFISNNETTDYNVSTQSYSITKLENGFKLSIATKSNKDVILLEDENLFVQLSYIPVNEVARAYLNGTLVNKTAEGERIYEFDIITNYDIDSNDNLILDSFMMFTEEVKHVGSSLLNTFDIVYSTNNITSLTYKPDSSDLILGRFLLPQEVFGITHENIRIKFGNSLKNLWARSRSVVSSSPFVKYEENVPWLYEKDVYKIDPISGASFSFDGDGNVTYTILHKQGDPVLDEENKPVIRYYKGENKLDAFGNPTPTDIKLITRQVDMMFIEGAYWFATDTAAAKYRNDMVSTIVDWLTVDFNVMGGSLLEQTRLFFYPKKSMGRINVIVNDGQVTTVEAGQAFKAELYVRPEVYKNSELRTILTKTTIKTIDNLLKKPTISVSEITSVLRSNYGSDVISLKLTGLGGDMNLETLTVINESDRCSIRKRLIKLPDDKLIVQEDIDCIFINYQGA